jgi:aldose sugar dehydrogenase
MQPEQSLQQPDLSNNQQPPQVSEDPNKKLRLYITIGLVIFMVVVGFWYRIQQKDETKTTTDTSESQTETPRSTEAPTLKTSVVLENRNRVWDLAFLPTKEMLFTERSGTVSVLKDGNVTAVAKIDDVFAQGEGGLLGMAVDPKFADNRYIYTCYNTTTDIRIVRWTLKTDLSGLDARTDIVTGAPRNPSGRHSGCRMAFGLDGYLWIGTGDTAQNITPQTPQNPKSLGGKVLRVDRDGKAAPGNLGGEFDARVYSYGHRNTQGIAFFEKAINGVSGVSAEHGSSVDDEVNLLKPGNFGWAPPDGEYDESVPMTDTSRFPDAVEALWSSGDPTQAPSGVAVLKGQQWKAWDGAVAVAMLKGQHLKILQLDDKLKVTNEEQLFKNEFLRIRAAVQGPDGSLYLSTDNGTNTDKIIRVTPK